MVIGLLAGATALVAVAGSGAQAAPGHPSIDGRWTQDGIAIVVDSTCRHPLGHLMRRECRPTKRHPATARPTPRPTATPSPSPTPPPTAAVTPTPTPVDQLTPRGDPTAFSFIYTDSQGRPAHWDKCHVIRYRINMKDAPASALADINEAVRRMSWATHFNFEFVGESTMVPYVTPGWGRALIESGPDADLYFAFVDHTQISGFPDRGGRGGSAYRIRSDGVREPQSVLGGVMIDFDTSATPGAGPGFSMVTLVLHELGHVMGLGHSSAADQLMFHESSSSTRPMLEAGDLAGLQKLYEYPCF
jgi:hypothetical protein